LGGKSKVHHRRNPGEGPIGFNKRIGRVDIAKKEKKKEEFWNLELGGKGGKVKEK